MSRQNDCVTFVIEGIPPTENHAIKQGRNFKRYPSKEYQYWKWLVSQLKPQKIKTSTWYGCEIVFEFPILNKNGTVKRKDVHNYIKYAIDEVIKKITTYNELELDDKVIIEGSYSKVDSKNPKTTISFYCV